MSDKAASGSQRFSVAEYPTNSALYADSSLTEGVDYARRFRRHPGFDDDLVARHAIPLTTILAPHGGGIEGGTSELCLAIAGYHPADLQPTPADGPFHDYWMFEGLRATGNAELHVTSTGCDDHVARALAAGSLNALGLHGCTTAQAELPDGTQAVLVGGLGTALKELIILRLTETGVRALDADTVPDLNGDEPTNIANRTLLGAGAQLELTTPLRRAMFRINTREDRKNTTLPIFWTFSTAVRLAIADMEATQPIP
ncbi:hypothetical protein E0H73_20345 [Kribbella pittospori]|uniref:Phage replication protein n=1 Tax=Kribbella pittospori TaxID=722689 RepID=A0A4V2MAR1_9ACTN|nr:poly-gamma-glutamate hydrolase family protein [Kribbella pittospori]TCC60302.1 hypothetical protein E0H73_20345 [Kribbella pittospori]